MTIMQPTIQANNSNRFGARVYPLNERTALVKQTVKDGSVKTDEYQIDMIDGKHRERHVELSNDAEIAQAVREALKGMLRTDG